MFKRALLGIALNGIALYIVTYALSEVTYEGGFKFFLIGSIIIGILNSILKPILKIISFPLVFLTAGLFLIVINGAILFAFDYVLDVIDITGISFNLSGFKNYLAAALLFGIINWIEHLFFKKK